MKFSHSLTAYVLTSILSTHIFAEQMTAEANGKLANSSHIIAAQNSLHIGTESAIGFDEIQAKLNQYQHPIKVNKTSGFYAKSNNAANLATDDTQLLNYSEALSFTTPQVYASAASNFNFNWVNQVKAGYQYGSFSAETGIISETHSNIESQKFYLQGAYKVYQFERFSLSLTASLEQIDANLLDFYSNDLFISTRFDSNKLLNSSIGLVGQYQFSDRWSVIGSVTSSSFNNDLPKTTNINNAMAVIGTRYAF